VHKSGEYAEAEEMSISYFVFCKLPPRDKRSIIDEANGPSR
jgi:hypothetical protein